MKSTLLFFALILAFASCEQEYDYNIKIIKKSGRYAVYDNHAYVKSFIYMGFCDSAILVNDSIVSGFIRTHKICWGQPDSFYGYSTKDSALVAAEQWRKYAYGKP